MGMAEAATPIPAWFWRSAAAVLFVAVAFALLFWIDETPPAGDTVAEQWMKAVSHYGIEPVYPPQEDIYVGDVFAIIARDKLYDVSLGPLPTRAIKVGHIDFSAEIEREYKDALKLPYTVDYPGDGKIWKQDPGATSLFTAGEAMKTLPAALLPDFKITAKRAGKSDFAGLGAVFGFSASHEIETTLRPQGILTYGVFAPEAEWRLEEFCKEDDNVGLCAEAGLRQQLAQIVGADILKVVTDPASGKPGLRYDVQLSLITRVYLMRRLETEIDDKRDGAANAGKQADASGAADPSSPHGSASLESRSGSEISVPPQVFERPLVLGYRSVRRQGEPMGKAP
jgi:hypothetical protein